MPRIILNTYILDLPCSTESTVSTVITPGLSGNNPPSRHRCSGCRRCLSLSIALIRKVSHVNV